MGDILFHSKSSARRFGGQPEDYAPIHKFLDQSKLYIADWRHRALLHSTFGISLCEQFFGDLFTRPSDGELVSTRAVAEQHILEDLNAIPTPAEFLREMPLRRWMNGMTPDQKRRMQTFSVEEEKDDVDDVSNSPR